MRTDESLPSTGRTLVARDHKVGLEAEFTGDGRHNFARVGAVSREESTLEHDLEGGERCIQLIKLSGTYIEEELAIERARSGVERRALGTRVSLDNQSHSSAENEHGRQGRRGPERQQSVTRAKRRPRRGRTRHHPCERRSYRPSQTAQGWYHRGSDESR